MKKTIFCYVAAVAALAMTACSKDDAAKPGTPENPDTATPFTITASIEDGADTRISMDDDGVNKIALKWKTDDQIFVVNNDTGSTLYMFTAQSVSVDGKTAAFICSYYPAGSTPAYAIHIGSAASASFDPKNVLVSNYYFYSKNPENAPNNFPLCATYDADSRKLVFKPLFALLKLIVTLPQEAQGDLGTLNLASSDGASIFYKGYYDVTQEPFARGNYTVNKLSYPCYKGGSLAANETAPLYLPVPPGTDLAGKSIVITLPVGGVSYTTTITGGNLVAGKCYPLTLPASKWTQVVQ